MRYREVFDIKASNLNKASEEFFTSVEEFLKSHSASGVESLEQVRPLLNEIDTFLKSLREMSIDFKLDDINTVINGEYNIKQKSIDGKRDELISKFKERIEQIQNEKRQEILKQNEEIRSRNNKLLEEIEASNSRYRQLEAKRQQLLEYSEDILQVCSDYGIKVSEISLDNDMFTIDEFESFYAEFSKFLQVNANKRNFIRVLRDKLNENYTTLGIILLIAFICMFTPVLDILSIVFIFHLLCLQATQSSFVKKYSILAGLAFNVHPMELGLIKEISDDQLEQELSEDIDVDSDPDLLSLYDKFQEDLGSIDDESIKSEKANELAAFVGHYKELEKEVNSLVHNVDQKRSNYISRLIDLKEEIEFIEQDLKSKIKLLGSDFSEDFVINTTVKLGMNTDTYIYENVDLGMQNVVIKSSGNNPNDIDAFIKVLMVNFYSNVRPGYLDITIFDPNGLGSSMAGFYNPETEHLYRFETENLNKPIKDLLAYIDTVIKVTKGIPINEYNRKAADIGKVTLSYKLLIILSQPKSIEENEALRSLMEYSADYGVFIWIVSDSTFKNTKVFNKPFENIKSPIKINRQQFPIDSTNNFVDKLKSLKTPALMFDVFINKVVPIQNMWKQNADEFIELMPGFEDGDSSKYKGYTVGNTGDIHAICVGGTGAGKSVFINHLIATIARTYSPKDVSLWLVDFKGSEFTFYLKKPEIGHNYLLPHISACLCTSDPDYSVSLFGVLRQEAEDRYKFLMDKGFKNMYEYNKAMRKQGHPELCMTRTLIIVDEFQVIFEKTDGKAQDLLKKHITYIAKVARACGVHLFFCSQSMKGTMSADILSQFTLRFGLRCDMEVSKAIMGTSFSGDIREKNGFLYIRSIDDKKLELQKRYRTPFIPDDQLLGTIELAAKKANEIGFKRDKEPIQYDERTKHNIEELDALYKGPLSKTDNNCLFILGERMVYSDKGRRSNFKLLRENNQHIFSIFGNMDDYVMFFMTLQRNLQYNGNHKCIYNTSVTDTGYLCCIDKIIDDSNSMFYTEEQNPSTLIDVFEGIAEGRKKVDDPNKLNPLFIFCINWDKALGFGIDSKYQITDRYVKLLQTCGVLHMHFIFICSSRQDIPKALVNSCKHKIAGKCDSKSSMDLLESEAASKVYDSGDNGYMFYNRSGLIERLKIYQSNLTRKLKENMINI